jgi:hypothetical protein
MYYAMRGKASLSNARRQKLILNNWQNAMSKKLKPWLNSQAGNWATLERK